MIRPAFEDQRRAINRAYERMLPCSVEGRAILKLRQAQAMPGGAPEQAAGGDDGSAGKSVGGQ